MRKSVLSALAVCAAVACAPKTDTASAPAAPDPAAVRHVIDSSNAVFVAALTKGDTAVMGHNYANDAIVMMSGMPAMNGRAAVVQGMAAMLSGMTITNASFHTTDVVVDGGLAVEHGMYEMTVQEKGKAAMTDKGKYVTVWQKQGDGSWKIIRDISNSDTPPQ